MPFIQETRKDILELKKLMRKVHSDRIAAIKSFYCSMKAQGKLYEFMKRRKDSLDQVLHELHVKNERQRIYVDLESDDSE